MSLTPNEIKEFLNKDLIKELELDEVSDEARIAILSKLADVVYLRFINKLAEILEDEDAMTLEDMINRQAADEFQKFIEEKVPNYNDILAEIIAEEKKILLENAKIE
jgi:hypothetical protein